MAELKRKNEEQLTTADLADRTEKKQAQRAEPRPPEVRPKDEWNTRAVRPPSESSEGRAATRDESPDRPTLIKSETSERKQEGAPGGATPVTSTSLFSESDVNDLRGRWSNVQSDFVDQPRQAVEHADKLVATVMQRLADGFANERSGLEKQWARGGDVSTEDLRVALQRYRSFFDRLLNA